MLKGRAGDLRHHVSKLKGNYKLTPWILGSDMFLNPPRLSSNPFQKGNGSPSDSPRPGGLFAVPSWHQVPFSEGLNLGNTHGWFQGSTWGGLQGCRATRFGELGLGRLQEEPNFTLVQDTSKAEPSQVWLVGHRRLRATDRPSSQRQPTAAAAALSLIFHLSLNPRGQARQRGGGSPPRPINPVRAD